MVAVAGVAGVSGSAHGDLWVIPRVLPLLTSYESLFVEAADWH